MFSTVSLLGRNESTNATKKDHAQLEKMCRVIMVNTVSAIQAILLMKSSFKMLGFFFRLKN
jgi:hypothetical protein